MQLITSNGTILNDQEGADVLFFRVQDLNRYIEEKGLQGKIRFFRATFQDGTQELVALDVSDSQPIYSSTNYEACCIWIDMIAFAEESAI